jgi:hypothetical protein
MDSSRFDHLTKAWASPGTRRGALRLLVGGTLGGVLALDCTRRRTLAAAPACASDDDCRDARLCTDFVCEAGRCTYPPLPEGTACPDGGNPCTTDVCDGAGTCRHLPKADGAVCGDGRVCSHLHCCPVARPSFCALTGQ